MISVLLCVFRATCRRTREAARRGSVPPRAKEVPIQSMIHPICFNFCFHFCSEWDEYVILGVDRRRRRGLFVLSDRSA
jgi:hypothetical protein